MGIRRDFNEPELQRRAAAIEYQNVHHSDILADGAVRRLYEPQDEERRLFLEERRLFCENRATTAACRKRTAMGTEQRERAN
ncbi:MAG TPA: hypothetical protein VGQ60_04725 [Nitrospiraceae bacterium]|nr:hypothetical protein [Nitrospiraceae bacterium]